MSGHSKWATIKRAKAVNDAKKGAVFTKLGNILTVAAREKGGDPETNFALRIAIEKAKSANMPKENIEKAVKRGTGELGGEKIEELYYEGIGPANSQFIIKSLTDNKNRSASTIRHLFSKSGGSFGSVMWNFEKKGVVRIAKSSLGDNFEADDFELELIDAGAQEVLREEEGMTVYSNPEDMAKLKKMLDEKNIGTESADIEYVSKDDMEVSGSDLEKTERFIEELEDCEDVSEYYTNLKI
jgi:YebC/PmpR family DNA-binding regulatory protein